MNRSTLKRLGTLERQAPKDTGKSHVILVSSDEEEERRTAALKASPDWTEGDDLMVIRLVGLILMRCLAGPPAGAGRDEASHMGRFASGMGNPVSGLLMRPCCHANRC